jgi:hypothetical protein
LPFCLLILSSRIMRPREARKGPAALRHVACKRK